MFIRHNIAAMNTTRQLGIANKNVSKHLERLSTCMQINRAGDDVAGLSISEKMRAQISGLSKANANTQESISLIQTAEGALGEIHTILARGRELAIQALNDTNTDEDREKLQTEINQLFEEIDSIAQNTSFNTMKLFDEPKKELKLQLGANKNEIQKISFEKMSVSELALTQNVTKIENTDSLILEIDHATQRVSEQRSQLGAWQNSFEHHIKNLAQTGENLDYANTIIRDSNVASEVMKMTKNEVLQQTMQATMMHSNMKNDWILNVLK